MIKEILLLGNPKLYETSTPVLKEELEIVRETVADLHDTLFEYRRKYGAGRAIAAPQIGVQKRLIYMYIDQPVVFINPSLTFIGDELMEVMDDCMSFPGLLVKVHRYRRCGIRYMDMDWKPKEMELEGDLSELLQHEYDHLDGILATMRADDNKSFYIAK
jgi:peptide deformylase